MNILIASDSFKDALNSTGVCKAIERGLKLANPNFQTCIFPLADGGEGVKEVLDFHLRLETKTFEVHDPLFRKIQARYGICSSELLDMSHEPSRRKENAELKAQGSKLIAFMEMAQASGLQLLKPEERNPLKTTTFGVGEMILDSIKHGAQKIILGIGGSSTNDLGIGMATALGWKFLDKNNNELIPIGENLIKVESIIPPNRNFWEKIDVEVMCDVTNPLLGKSGAAHTYAKQKGASENEIHLLERGAEHFSRLVNNYSFTITSGAGAAGGLGFGCLYFLNATIKSGIYTLMDLTGFDKHVAWADIIITGEGKLDEQTAHGKLISGVISRSQNKPVIALCGALNISPKEVISLRLKAVFQINPKITSLAEALKNTAENLEKTAFNIGRLIDYGL